jgi:hypothetical protein
MTNTALLNQLIAKSGFKKCYIAERLGLSRAGLNNCIANRAEFKASHIATLCELLGIKDFELKEAIFFNRSGA